MVRPLEWCLPGAGVVPDLPFGSALPTMCRVTAATFSALHASLSSLSSTCYSLVSLLSFQHDSSGAAISSNAPLCEWPFEPGILTAPGVSPSDRAGRSLCRFRSPTCPRRSSGPVSFCPRTHDCRPSALCVEGLHVLGSTHAVRQHVLFLHDIETALSSHTS